MKDVNHNKTKFNLPAYIQIPLFLYQDNRLEKAYIKFKQIDPRRFGITESIASHTLKRISL